MSIVPKNIQYRATQELYSLFIEWIDPRTSTFPKEDQDFFYESNPEILSNAVSWTHIQLRTPAGQLFLESHHPTMCKGTRDSRRYLGGRCFASCANIHSLPLHTALTELRQKPRDTAPPETDTADTLMLSIDPRGKIRPTRSMNRESVKYIQSLISSLDAENIKRNFIPILCEQTEECSDDCPFIHNNATLRAFLFALEEAKHTKTLFDGPVPTEQKKSI